MTKHLTIDDPPTDRATRAAPRRVMPDMAGSVATRQGALEAFDRHD